MCVCANVPAFLDTKFNLDSVTSSVFFKYMFQIYKVLGKDLTSKLHTVCRSDILHY